MPLYNLTVLFTKQTTEFTNLFCTNEILSKVSCFLVRIVLRVFSQPILHFSYVYLYLDIIGRKLIFWFSKRKREVIHQAALVEPDRSGEHLLRQGTVGVSIARVGIDSEP